jgi:(heptosyl)LPS beta-1,4-glucosyltransferase
MISVVINTRNEEKNLPRALDSVEILADEVIVVDMESEDNTVKIAKKAGAKVYLHKKVGYVEPARNFAIGKATGSWILVLDADEEIPASLAKELKRISEGPQADFYRLPRKNIIFGKWITHTGWWPDYNIRFFKKGTVVWKKLIHSVPETQGKGQSLPAKEQFAIIHHNYQSISQYLERMTRYTQIQAKFLIKDGYRFSWQDLIRRPTSEFLSRFFANEGYKDGIHGLALSLLQAFSELVVYARVWEHNKFEDINFSNKAFAKEVERAEDELAYWLDHSGVKRMNLVQKLLRKI